MAERKVTAIPATIAKYTAVPIFSKKKRRVAGYARVSTDHEDQASSYEAQVDYYTHYIKSRDDWEFVSIYTDDGISATSTKRREGFKAMIADALAGKIDLIITKSISRFARNTVDSLLTQRKLAGLKNPVGVFFETENLNSLEKGNDIIMTVLSATAQEESHVKSEIMVQSLMHRFNMGIFLTPEHLGCDKDEDGNLVINEEEADTVRLMYYLFLSGFSTKDIAEILTSLGRETKLGNAERGHPYALCTLPLPAPLLPPLLKRRCRGAPMRSTTASLLDFARTERVADKCAIPLRQSNARNRYSLP